MPTKPVPFRERSVRRAIRAAQKEQLAVERVEIAADGSISLLTAQRLPLDLTDDIEKLGLDESCARTGEAA